MLERLLIVITLWLVLLSGINGEESGEDSEDSSSKSSTNTKEKQKDFSTDTKKASSSEESLTNQNFEHNKLQEFTSQKREKKVLRNLNRIDPNQGPTAATVRDKMLNPYETPHSKKKNNKNTIKASDQNLHQEEIDIHKLDGVKVLVKSDYKNSEVENKKAITSTQETSLKPNEVLTNDAISNVYDRTEKDKNITIERGANKRTDLSNLSTKNVPASLDKNPSPTSETPILNGDKTKETHSKIVNRNVEKNANAVSLYEGASVNKIKNGSIKHGNINLNKRQDIHSVSDNESLNMMISSKFESKHELVNKSDSGSQKAETSIGSYPQTSVVKKSKSSTQESLRKYHFSDHKTTSPTNIKPTAPDTASKKQNIVVKTHYINDGESITQKTIIDRNTETLVTLNQKVKQNQESDSHHVLGYNNSDLKFVDLVLRNKKGEKLNETHKLNLGKNNSDNTHMQYDSKLTSGNVSRPNHEAKGINSKNKAGTSETTTATLGKTHDEEIVNDNFNSSVTEKAHLSIGTREKVDLRQNDFFTVYDPKNSIGNKIGDKEDKVITPDINATFVPNSKDLKQTGTMGLSERSNKPKSSDYELNRIFWKKQNNSVNNKFNSTSGLSENSDIVVKSDDLLLTETNSKIAQIKNTITNHDVKLFNSFPRVIYGVENRTTPEHMRHKITWTSEPFIDILQDYESPSMYRILISQKFKESSLKPANKTTVDQSVQSTENSTLSIVGDITTRSMKQENTIDQSRYSSTSFTNSVLNSRRKISFFNPRESDIFTLANMKMILPKIRKSSEFDNNKNQSQKSFESEEQSKSSGFLQSQEDHRNNSSPNRLYKKNTKQTISSKKLDIPTYTSLKIDMLKEKDRKHFQNNSNYGILINESLQYPLLQTDNHNSFNSQEKGKTSKTSLFPGPALKARISNGTTTTFRDHKPIVSANNMVKTHNYLSLDKVDTNPQNNSSNTGTMFPNDLENVKKSQSFLLKPKYSAEILNKEWKIEAGKSSYVIAVPSITPKRKTHFGGEKLDDDDKIPESISKLHEKLRQAWSKRKRTYVPEIKITKNDINKIESGLGSTKLVAVTNRSTIMLDIPGDSLERIPKPVFDSTYRPNQSVTKNNGDFLSHRFVNYEPENRFIQKEEENSNRVFQSLSKNIKDKHESNGVIQFKDTSNELRISKKTKEDIPTLIPYIVRSNNGLKTSDTAFKSSISNGIYNIIRTVNEQNKPVVQNGGEKSSLVLTSGIHKIPTILPNIARSDEGMFLGSDFREGSNVHRDILERPVSRTRQIVHPVLNINAQNKNILNNSSIILKRVTTDDKMKTRKSLLSQIPRNRFTIFKPDPSVTVVRETARQSPQKTNLLSASQLTQIQQAMNVIRSGRPSPNSENRGTLRRNNRFRTLPSGTSQVTSDSNIQRVENGLMSLHFNRQFNRQRPIQNNRRTILPNSFWFSPATTHRHPRSFVTSRFRRV